MRPYGGDEEDRTPDPLLAKQVLSQLSYTPIFGFPSVFQASHCGTVFFSTLKIEQCFLSTLRSPLLTEASELSFVLLRKEVIQPHLPIRLPCYDFTPVINPTLDGVLPKVRRPALGVTDSHGVTGGVYKAPGTYSPQHADLRLLAIPTSCRRVAACNLNWDNFLGICSTSLYCFPLLYCHCSTCVAQVIRGMMI